MDYLLLLLTVTCYFLATFIWLGYLWIQKEAFYRYGIRVAALGWLSHTVAVIVQTIDQGFFPVANIGGTLSLLSWTLISAFLILTWRYPVKVLGALVSPMAALMVCGSLILPSPGQIPPALQSFWLTFHIAASFMGIATLTLAFLAGIIYLVQEHQLKTKNFGFFFKRLPSLEMLDVLNYYCINIGFFFFTLGLISGSLYAQWTLGTFWQWDPKETMTLIAWLLYAGLLHERLVVGWRGRRAALMAIAGFFILLITFVGADFWQHSYHRFGNFGRLP